MKLHYLALAASLAWSFPLQAQEQPEAEKKVEVSGVKDPALRPYRQMQKGLEAFDKHHALAPKTSLRFELWTADHKMPDPAGLTMRIAGDTVDIPVAIDEKATFALPFSREAADENAELILNRKKDQMRWRPQVRSPGVPDNARRLGDMRLECEVSWAVMKDEVSFVARMAAAPFGGMCHAPLIGLFYRAPKPLAAATLVSGERKQALALHNKGTGFLAPLRDKSWDDDSLIVYEFADEKEAPEAP